MKTNLKARKAVLNAVHRDSFMWSEKMAALSCKPSFEQFVEKIEDKATRAKTLKSACILYAMAKWAKENLA